MIFIADEMISNKCVAKWKKKMYLYAAAFVTFCTLEVVIRYHSGDYPNRYDTSGAIVIGIISVWWLYAILKGIFRDADGVNKLIRKIEIEDKRVSFETFEVSLFFNLYVRTSYEITTTKPELELRESIRKYDLDRELTKAIYVVEYGDSEFLLAENFFTYSAWIKDELKKAKDR